MNKEQEKNSENLKNDFTLRLLMTYKETIVDGIGLRYSLYFSGCSHACPAATTNIHGIPIMEMYSHMKN